jgi:hypothetical protein
VGVFSPSSPGIVQVLSFSPKSNATIGSQIIGAVETTWTVPAGTLEYRVKVAKASGAAIIYFATTLGGTSTNDRYTLYPEGELKETGLVIASPGLTYYVRASKPGTILETWTWS